MLPNQPIISYQQATQLFIEIYIQPPTRFVIENYSRLLPEYKFYPQTMVIILLEAEISLEKTNQQVQQEKQRLKKEFLKLGENIRAVAQREKWLIEVIDPQDGKPINSASGEITFDIVSVVHNSLGFRFNKTNNSCKLLNHPLKETAIYPNLILSDIDNKQMNYLIEEALS
ncbi:MAG: methylmalonic aciduria and homocystinuria type D protein [cyanobacterium endosymbiont of Rhopalodia musculus]|uniref:methylmalonic aciduria and homocystinuria type D protein n=1 Tax=cyanobacterium endosymbiont of Epithemia clementina EcSB TaxID=3034674 RepID=UPI0024816E19|nr:methylmalonic aciduria and homocystinuria type D protein [cyanobacterium endosymbiont of Epithemia clementina EcSB]WGT68283.1 methylmalonic aciduria and homocystinuria type D protein [cyanobacterium endosymbiont of Epithemia clementina EcSB]